MGVGHWFWVLKPGWCGGSGGWGGYVKVVLYISMKIDNSGRVLRFGYGACEGVFRPWWWERRSVFRSTDRQCRGDIPLLAVWRFGNHDGVVTCEYSAHDSYESSLLYLPSLCITNWLRIHFPHSWQFLKGLSERYRMQLCTPATSSSCRSCI